MADNSYSPSLKSRLWEACISLFGVGADLITAMSTLVSSPMPTFPYSAMRGTIGELARELAKGTEVPEEFVYASALTCLGAILSGQLRLNIGLKSDTRLYTVLLGKSYTGKKSSAMQGTLNFFRSLQSPQPWTVSNGVASAEGLLETLQESQRTLLAYDEVRAFIDKTKIQSSVLLPMVTSLFEQHDWDNRSKGKNLSVQDARLSFLGCCTLATYEHVFSTEAIAIGLPNRLFIVNADAKPRVAWPGPPDEAKLAQLRKDIQLQLAQLPAALDATDEAKAEWEEWYKNLPSSEHAKRLDTIGFRLMPLLAFSSGKRVIDVEIIRDVIAILDYELRLRILSDPIDADNNIAKMEEKIRRYLQQLGTLTERELRGKTNADRYGVWAFEAAIKNLQNAEDIFQVDKKKWALNRQTEG